MEVSFRYIEDFDLVLQIITGEVTTAGLIDARRRDAPIMGDHPDCDGLADLRGATLNDPTVAREWTQHLAENYPHAGRLAIVASDAVTTAIAMIFATHGGPTLQRPIEVFSTVGGALSWLGHDPEKCNAEVLGIDTHES